MNIGSMDASDIDFSGPGRPKDPNKVEPKIETFILSPFVTGSLVRVMSNDQHGMPQNHAGREGKITAMHSNIFAADVTFNGSISTETIWLTSLELLN